MKILQKTKSEQDADFKEFEKYADPKCPTCHGTAKVAWDCDLEQYIPCECIMKKIAEEFPKKHQGKEVSTFIQKLRGMFRIN